MSKPGKVILLIVFGLPGTGKSTLSRLLSKKLGWLHLNTDIIREQLNLRGKYDNHSKERVYREMYEATKKQLTAQKSVIVDGTFYLKKHRQSYYDLAATYQCSIKWIEMQADDETVQSRISKKRRYSEADFDIYEKIKAAFEPVLHETLVIKSNEISESVMMIKIGKYLEL
jgi:predicted kinase